MNEAGGTVDVLIVEREAAVLKALARLLALEGFSVRTASDSVEALAVLSSPDRPRVIVLDLALRPLSAVEFLAHCQSDPALRMIPVIVLAASMPPGTFEQLKVADILSKPPSRKVLVNTVRKHCLPRPG